MFAPAPRSRTPRVAAAEDPPAARPAAVGRGRPRGSSCRRPCRPRRARSLLTVVGSTQASSVIALVRCSEAESGIVTRELEPLKLSACRTCPPPPRSCSRSSRCSRSPTHPSPSTPTLIKRIRRHQPRSRGQSRREPEISANASAASTTTEYMAGRRGNDSTVVTPATFTAACSSSQNLECLLILPRIRASQHR